jgi:hypothetical protein
MRTGNHGGSDLPDDLAGFLDDDHRMVSAVEHDASDVLHRHTWKLFLDQFHQFGEAGGTIAVSVVDDNMELDVALLLCFVCSN